MNEQIDTIKTQIKQLEKDLEQVKRYNNQIQEGKCYKFTDDFVYYMCIEQVDRETGDFRVTVFYNNYRKSRFEIYRWYPSELDTDRFEEISKATFENEMIKQIKQIRFG